MPAPYSLHDKVVLVTGAARGIGFETARLAHARGAAVVLTDLGEDVAVEAAVRIGPRALGLAADATDRERMDAVVAETVERFGRLDVVVANAGVGPPLTSARTVDEAVWERVVDIDLLGVWRTVRAALPQVVANRGQVVVISSVYAWMNGVLASPYAVSKAGVESLGRALRLELRPHGASATVAHFGFIDTTMVEEAFSDPLAQRLEATYPAFIRKRLTPADAGASVVRGLERRAPRVILPGWWRVWFALRGILNPITDELFARDRDLLQVIRDAESPERARSRGGLDVTAGRPA